MSILRDVNISCLCCGVSTIHVCVAGCQHFVYIAECQHFMSILLDSNNSCLCCRMSTIYIYIARHLRFMFMLDYLCLLQDVNNLYMLHNVNNLSVLQDVKRTSLSATRERASTYTNVVTAKRIVLMPRTNSTVPMVSRSNPALLYITYSDNTIY